LHDGKAFRDKARSVGVLRSRNDVLEEVFVHLRVGGVLEEFFDLGFFGDVVESKEGNFLDESVFGKGTLKFQAVNDRIEFFVGDWRDVVDRVDGLLKV